MKHSEKQLFILQMKIWIRGAMILIVVVTLILVGGDRLKKGGGRIVKFIAAQIESVLGSFSAFSGREKDVQRYEKALEN